MNLILDPAADASQSTMDFLIKSLTNKKAAWKRGPKQQESCL